jgi:photosystem II stability/assembly factor-like uncharacterized protein
VAWTRLDTADAHSLAFRPGGTEHLYFGHHGGILESVDGGRTWRPLAARADAMSMGVGDGTTLYIAGHEVFQASRDGGRTWSDIETDLPNLDIHAFTRDPADPLRMWAYLAEGGVYESADGGTAWRRVHDGHGPFLTAVRGEQGTRLLGLDPTAGLAQSADGGATWSVVSPPPASPVVSLAAVPDGGTVLLGAGDGLYRSDDGGVSWKRILAVELPLAIAISNDGNVIAVVTRATDFYRSDDGGATWPGP